MKIKIALILAGLFILSGCHFNHSIKLNIRQFTDRYCDSLRARFPDDRFCIRNESTIEVIHSGKKITIASDNAFRLYENSPDSLNSIINTYVLADLDCFTQHSQLDLNNVVPIIKSREYVENWQAKTSKIGANGTSAPVIEKYNDQLIIAYAVDKKKSITFLTQNDLASLGVSLDSLRGIAINNLNRILDEVKINGENGNFIITAGGNYEASLILDEMLFTKENIKVKGDFVIGIPNRDILLITGSQDKEGLAKIKKSTNESFESGDHEISNDLFRWNGKKFIKF